MIFEEKRKVLPSNRIKWNEELTHNTEQLLNVERLHRVYDDDIKSDLNVNTLNNLSQYCRFVVIPRSYLHVLKINFSLSALARFFFCGGKERLYDDDGEYEKAISNIWSSNYSTMKY